MEYGLKDSVIRSIKNIFCQYPKIEQVLLYGSRAKGNYKNGSDIDLTLIGKDITIEELNRIYLDLDELYLPYSFDISIYEKIQNKELINHINRIGVAIYEKNKYLA